jgi:hypothetical protein
MEIVVTDLTTPAGRSTSSGISLWNKVGTHSSQKG